ncbi:MAG TPA: stage III sporulation protein AE, partial [Firmicutes bacterium]|nr:stage III sporulation protein AE [Bacillota bacterium]
MKRILCTIAVLLCLFCFCPVFAQETGEEVQNDTQQYQDMLQSSGAGELMEEAPDKTQELLEEYGISSLDPQSILSLKPGDLFSLLWNLLVEQLKSPLRTVSCVLAVVILCALLENMQGAFAQSTMRGVFSVVSTLCIAGIVVVPVTKCIMECVSTIQSICNFMLCFIPVMTTVMTASGQPVTAGAYNLFLFGACEVIAKIAASTLVPLLCMYLALCLVGSVTTNLKIAPVSSSLKSIMTWALGFLITL